MEGAPAWAKLWRPRENLLLLLLLLRRHGEETQRKFSMPLVGSRSSSLALGPSASLPRSSLETHFFCSQCLITVGDGLISVFGAYPIWDSGSLLFYFQFFPVLADNSFRKLHLKEAPPVRFFPTEALEAVGIRCMYLPSIFSIFLRC